MYHKDLNDQITSNHKTTLSRIGNIETKQASILTTARVAVVCLVIVWGAITAWLTIIGPALDSRIASNISNGKVTTVVSTSPASNSVVIDHGIKKTDTND
jgi:maleate cis-trans isomerase